MNSEVNLHIDWETLETHDAALLGKRSRSSDSCSASTREIVIVYHANKRPSRACRRASSQGTPVRSKLLEAFC